MALEQRKFATPHVHEQEIPKMPTEHQTQKRKRKWFSPGEKFLFVVFASLLAIFSSFLLQREGALNNLSRDIQSIGSQIEQTSKQNTELSIQVKEQSTYERVWEKARELGLNLNEKNVKVVPGR